MIKATVQINLNGLQKFAEHVNNGTGPIQDALKQWGVRYRAFAQRRFDKYSKRGGDWPPLSETTLRNRRGSTIPKRQRRRAFNGPRPKYKPVKSIGPQLAKLAKQRSKAIRTGNVKAVNRFTQQRLKLKAKRAEKVLNERKKRAEKIGIAKATHNTNETRRQEAIKAKITNALNKKRARTSILRDTGLLFAALNPTLNTEGGFENIEGLTITVGYGGPSRHLGDGENLKVGNATIADIAAFHNVGAGHLPKRQIIVEPPVEVLNSMASDMERALKKLADGVSK